MNNHSTFVNSEDSEDSENSENSERVDKARLVPTVDPPTDCVAWENHQRTLARVCAGAKIWDKVEDGNGDYIE